MGYIVLRLFIKVVAVCKIFIITEIRPDAGDEKNG